jgi:hypothetical protein
MESIKVTHCCSILLLSKLSEQRLNYTKFKECILFSQMQENPYAKLKVLIIKDPIAKEIAQGQRIYFVF